MAHQLPQEVYDTCTGLVYCSFKWLNNVTSGFGMTGILIAFQVILYMATINRFGNTRAFGFSAMAGLFASLWLATMKLIDWSTASIFIIIGVIGLVSLILNEK